MYYLLLVVFLLLVVWFFTFASPSWRLRKFGNKVPGPGTWPVFGNSLVFLGVESILKTVLAACDAYGPVARVWIGKQLLFVLSDPADIEIFLSNSKFLEKSLPYRLFDSWLGTNGLLTSNGNTWKRHRKLITPSFHFEILESSVDSMKKNAYKLRDCLTDTVDKGEFDIFPYVQRCAVDIICDTAMGVDFKQLIVTNSRQFYQTTFDSIVKKYKSLDSVLERDKIDPQMEIDMINFNYYLDAVHKLRTIGMKRFFRPWLHPEWIFKQTISGQIYYTSLRAVEDTITSIIQERKHFLEEKMLETNEKDSTKEGKLFLDSLLEDGSFTDEEIENEVQTFMFGGSISIPTTIAFCLHLLSKHPDVQEKILQEIEMVKSEQQKDELAYQDYTSLKYLENVIKEALRMYTTVPLIARSVTQDVQLPSGHVLPAGSVAGICLLHVHRNEKHFANANQFIPERFEDKNRDRHPYSYIPFSAGPRNCIGQKYAMLEMKIVISVLLEKYRILPSQKIQSLSIETGFALMSLDGHPVQIASRTNSSQKQ